MKTRVFEVEAVEDQPRDRRPYLSVRTLEVESGYEAAVDFTEERGPTAQVTAGSMARVADKIRKIGEAYLRAADWLDSQCLEAKVRSRSRS